MAKTSVKKARRARKQIVIGKADLQPGDRRIMTVEGRSIGLFNVNGTYHALHNRCPHMGGPLCEGPVTGTAMPTEKAEFIYGLENELVRCAWHGWEFEIKSGRCLSSEKVRARSYAVTVEEQTLILHI